MTIDKRIWAGAVLSILMFTLSSGCLGGGDDDAKDEELSTYPGEFQTEGSVLLTAQAQPVTRTEEIHFDIVETEIVDITITVSVEDGDEGTDPDTVDSVRVWRETGADPDEIKEMAGGSTPYENSVSFAMTGNENMTNWWIVELTVTCIAGEDTWPGPLIWRGVPDGGFRYHIHASFNVINVTDQE